MVITPKERVHWIFLELTPEKKKELQLKIRYEVKVLRVRELVHFPFEDYKL